MSEHTTTQKRWGMVIDQDRCIGCWTCAVACKEENNQPEGVWWNHILTIGGEEIDTPAGEWPDLEARLPAGELLPLREPAVRAGVPGGRHLPA